MVEIDGKKYLTKEEMLKSYDNFIYLLNFKESMIECYKNQIHVLEELIEKLLIKIKLIEKEKENEEIKNN